MRTVVIGVQTEKGTPASSFDEIPNVSSTSLRPNVETLLEAVISSRLNKAMAPGGIHASGRIEVFASTKALELLLPALFLKQPSSTTVDGATEYTYTPWTAGDTMLYHTLVQIYGSEALQIVDAAIDSLELSIEGGEIPSMRLDVIGRSPSKITAPSYNSNTATLYGFHEATLKIEDTEVSAVSARLRMENNISDDFYTLGARELADILPAELNVEIEAEIKPMDMAKLEAYLGQPSSMNVELMLAKDVNNEYLKVSGTAVMTEHEAPIEGAEISSNRLTLRIIQGLSVVLRVPT